MENYEHVVTMDEENNRLDKLLVSLNEQHSRQQVQKWIKDNLVTVNSKHVKANYKCRMGDIIHWSIPEKISITIEAEPIPLSVIYEDDYLLVINKPKGLLVHPTHTVHSGTLVNALKHYTSQLSTISGKERPGIVHRLDQYTSGIMVICKDDETHLHLKKQFKQKTVKRIYEAIVYGYMKHEKGIINAPIGRHPKNRLKMAVISNGKEAETHFEIVERFNQFTYVQCQLITGRTHQIRVHMQYINHPIVGDEIYSSKKSKHINTQALYAKTLGFVHPNTEEYIQFSIDPPRDFEKLLHLYRLKS